MKDLVLVPKSGNFHEKVCCNRTLLIVVVLTDCARLEDIARIDDGAILFD